MIANGAVVVWAVAVIFAPGLLYGDERGRTGVVAQGADDASGGFLGYVRWLRETTVDSLAKLRATGSKVVMLEPIPVAPFNPIDCLSQSKYLEGCRYVANTTPVSLATDYRELAKQDPRVWSVNLNHLVCPYFPICDPIVDGQIVKWDPTHLTAAFARAIAPQLDTYLQ